MAKMGRPKEDNPLSHVVTVKFREEEYRVIAEYASRHNMTVSQMLREAVQLKINQDKK